MGESECEQALTGELSGEELRTHVSTAQNWADTRLHSLPLHNTVSLWLCVCPACTCMSEHMKGETGSLDSFNSNFCCWGKKGQYLNFLGVCVFGANLAVLRSYFRKAKGAL